MKAFIIDRYGIGASMRAREMPDPVMREDDVLVQIHAAGVNVLDSKIRAGEFKRLLPSHLPLILGNDVAGVVCKSDLECGDSSPATRSMRTEEPHDGRGRLNVFGWTVPWQALIEKAGLKKGQRVFVQAGSGGGGTVAIQLAKHVVRGEDQPIHTLELENKNPIVGAAEPPLWWGRPHRFA